MNARKSNDLNMQPYTWKNIEYLERPATSDEKEIASVLDGMLEATMNRDIELLASFIADDSTIVLQECQSIFQKKDFLEKMKKISASIKIMKYKNVLMRFPRPDEALVTCVRYIRFQNSHEELISRSFGFKRVDGYWKISKATSY